MNKTKVILETYSQIVEINCLPREIDSKRKENHCTNIQRK